ALDMHHVVEGGIVGIRALRAAEVGRLAGVPRDDVSDDDGAMAAGGRHHCLVLRLGSEGGIDLEADAVEVAVDGRRVAEVADASRAHHRAGVYALDPNRLECAPETLLGEAADDGGAG